MTAAYDEFLSYALYGKIKEEMMEGRGRDCRIFFVLDWFVDI